MTEQLIALEFLHPNKYQPRQHEDPVVVQELAENIERNATDEFDGLLQAPTVRHIGEGHYELAFGHTRKAAFALLFNQGKSRYGRMRAYVRDLSDVQMFEAAVAENIKRRDLNPIEQAESMRRYMDEFGKNSAEAGEFFNCSEENVRAKVRLLNLPEPVQTKMRAGEVNENTARTLLSMQRIADDKTIVETLKRVDKEKGNRLPDDIIESTADRLENVVDMWNDNHREGKPRAGYHGWLLDMKNFPNKLLPLLTGHVAVQALDCFNDKPAQKLVLEWAQYLAADAATFENKQGDEEYHAANKNQMQKRLDALAEIDPAYAAKLQHLVNPPACTACPFYTKIRGTHYCGIKNCYERKTEAWMRHQLEQTSKTTGIPLYVESDGRYVILVSHDDKCNALFTKKHAGLRLISKSKVSGYNYQNFKGIDDDICFVVATGEAITKLGNMSTKSGGGKKSEEEKAEMRAMKIYRARRKELVWEFAGVAKHLLDGVPFNVLERLERNIGLDDRPLEEPGDEAKLTVRADYLRKYMIYEMLISDSSYFRRESMADILESIQEQIKENGGWGVKIPKELIKLAEQWDAEIDSVAEGGAK